MTQIKPTQQLSPPPSGPLSEPPLPVEPGPSMGRLVGVDLARALAVFGMYVVHIGPPLSATSGVASWIRYLADGRSSILFATLAGFSVALIAGRREPKTGLAGRQAKARIAIRAVVLLAVGTAMAMVFGDVVILNFYGVYFLLALPLVRLRAKTLAITATVLAVVTPQLAFGLSSLLTEPVRKSINAYDPLERLCGVGVLDLLLTGFYPTITWMSFVIAGMALARLDLAAGSVRRRLAAFGPALIVLGYGTSRLLAGADALRSSAEDASGSSGSGSFGSGSFQPRGSASSLLLAGPHSGTTFDIIGSLGVAITVILCAMVAIDRLPWLRRLAKPVIAVGTMSLTAYVGHFVVSSFTGLAFKDSWMPLLIYIGGAIVFAGIWFRFFPRGPLEYLLHAATKLAKSVR
ncbi:membrane protein [Micromonospora sp. ATCC 39149]|nr:heparan-alpha-glucosaminide N-acetyltransferase domain-containing protein [Micromonospora sp. ATCC 39149]EEP70516.1 membrane protein [Micromonospora sp. ATCC 39149]